MKKKWYSEFADWRASAVQECFALQKVSRMPALAAWIDFDTDPTAAQMEVLDRIQQLMDRFQYGWNEYELMAGFIAPLLSLVSFPGAYHNLFHQRSLTLRDNGHKAEGSVDGLVAFGIDKPEIPFFFFLHEYKRSQGTEADPLGQLLIAMVAAQRLNADGQPLYGCYVIGKFWHFVLLEGQTYSVSQGYDATDAGELRIIWSVLVHTKQLIEERVKLILDSEL